MLHHYYFFAVDMRGHMMHHQHSSSHLSPEGINTNNFSMSFTDQQNMDNYDKAFYNKSDSTGPYATTAILANMPGRVSDVSCISQYELLGSDTEFCG